MAEIVEAISSDPVAMGEGPHWDVKRQALYYVDISGGSIHRYDTNTKEVDKVQVEKQASFVIPRRDNNDELVIGNQQSIQILNWNTGQLQTIATVDQEQPRNYTKLNDAKCDAVGRLWTGTLHNTNDLTILKPKQGTLYSLDAKHNLSKRCEEITISNGLAWSNNNEIMYYVDSIPGTVSAFDYDLGTGNISNRRTAIDFKKLGEQFGLPDGMTIDKAGKLWIACYGVGRVIRCDPETAKVLSVVVVPATKTTSCCFGGPNLSDLYVTSIRELLSEEQLKAQPLAGRVFKISGLGVAGSGDYTFAG